ncbi:MAG: hypothetical protein AW12_01405 [Candidatus Accumulibacter sp. BA-94]|uniref:protein YgfX n=1 Tax=Accumulibacter sp. TaxID=2053492 RepID=UPI0004480DCC|nr:protein YgfX [Accumulibacter sp.]EXI90873.1 MAG: hypothetical protein AW12_01405 [Candidatus Accumulibacter sp. BA-94]HCZ16867.1 hypothetical protein [Accumulibacter sp.]HRF72070.1 hypothetical protein [Accumulibacter sp.]
MQFPIHIDLRRSRLLSALTVLFHLLAAGCMLILPWPAALRYLLLPFVAVSAWYALRPSRFLGLRLRKGGELDGLLADGDSIPVLVHPGTVVFTQLIVLRVRDHDSGRGDSLALLPDSMSAEHFRLLRLWLRWRVEASGRVEGGV